MVGVWLVEGGNLEGSGQGEWQKRDEGCEGNTAKELAFQTTPRPTTLSTHHPLSDIQSPSPFAVARPCQSIFSNSHLHGRSLTAQRLNPPLTLRRCRPDDMSRVPGEPARLPETTIMTSSPPIRTPSRSIRPSRRTQDGETAKDPRG